MVIVVYRWQHQSHDIILYVVGHIIMYTVYSIHKTNAYIMLEFVCN